MHNLLKSRVLRPRLKLAPKVMDAAPIPQISAYADAADLMKRVKAQSIISGSLIEGKQCDLPTSDQADVILRWARV